MPYIHTRKNPEKRRKQTGHTHPRPTPHPLIPRSVSLKNPCSTRNAPRVLRVALKSRAPLARIPAGSGGYPVPAKLIAPSFRGPPPSGRALRPPQVGRGLARCSRSPRPIGGPSVAVSGGGGRPLPPRPPPRAPRPARAGGRVRSPGPLRHPWLRFAAPLGARSSWGPQTPIPPPPPPPLSRLGASLPPTLALPSVVATRGGGARRPGLSCSRLALALCPRHPCRSLSAAIPGGGSVGGTSPHSPPLYRNSPQEV